MINEKIVRDLEKTNVRFCLDYDTSLASSFRVGGRAELAVFPKNAQELLTALSLASRDGVRSEVIGNASNILFADGALSGVFIFTSGHKEYEFSDTRLICRCGASLTAMAKKAADNGLSGLEFAYGIPGTVGGAVYMNAGAYGSSVSEVLVSSTVYDKKSGRAFQLSAEKHGFDYRKSVYMDHDDWVCLTAEFSLKRDNKENILARMNEYISSRKAKQPLEYPNAGSYFKRPEGHFAGKLIEDCGLKGFSVGDACVSEKHAGFIINKGNATAGDILALEAEIKRRVYEAYGVALEREVRYVSN